MSTSPQSWRPLRAFDDGQKVYIEFPTGISQGEMPPLFVIGPAGGSELVNYRVSRNYYIVDRLFGAAELRLGDKDSERRVRIVRTDGRPRVMTTGGDDEPKAATAPGAPPDLRLQRRAAACHAPLAQGARPRCGVCPHSRLRTRLCAPDPQQGRDGAGTAQRGPAEGLYWACRAMHRRSDRRCPAISVGRSSTPALHRTPRFRQRPPTRRRSALPA